MQPLAVDIAPFDVIGIKARTTNRIEAVPQTAKIPELWRTFYADDVPSQLASIHADPEPVAIYTDYAGGHKGQYTTIIGHRVGADAVTPPGLVSAHVPAGRYLRFEAEGPMPDALIDAWVAIWRFFEFSHQYERAFSVDFEIHRPNEVEIYIALK